MVYTDSTIFSNTNATCTITCTIYDNRNQKDVTNDFISNGAKFSWKRVSSNGDADVEWNNAHKDRATNEITITARDDVKINAQFLCDISIDETKLQSDETQQS
mgnify:FL=1